LTDKQHEYKHRGHNAEFARSVASALYWSHFGFLGNIGAISQSYESVEHHSLLYFVEL
jgi:hypothetical protein